MGVLHHVLVNVLPDMNEHTPGTESSVLQRTTTARAESIQEEEGGVNTVLRNQGDVASVTDQLKLKMKLKLGHECLGHSVGHDHVTCDAGTRCRVVPTATNGHELSLSLPNLSSELDQLYKMNEQKTATRSSLSDIYKHPLGAITEFYRLADIRRSSVEECSACLKDTQNSELFRPNLISPGGSGRVHDLPVSVDGSNNRLSAVLENIPLLYIPHTKQLVSVNTQKVSNATTECDRGGESSDDLTPTYPHPCKDNCNNNVRSPTSCANGVSSSQEQSLDSSLDDAISEHLSSLDSKNCTMDSDYMVLSQDSDASSTCRSERTVVTRPQFTTNGGEDYKSVEFDDVSLDRLSKLSTERDSPQNALRRTNTIGSLSRTDASSFSSISSLSTGTDFSISAASCSDDLGELKNYLPAETDEAGFMEINLHSRNSYEVSSRNSSQDSGIDEKVNGAKPKRRGITSFLSRSLFSRKAKEQCADTGADKSAPGWKLFGRVPPKQAPIKDPKEICEEYQAKVKAATTTAVPSCTQPQAAPRVRKNDVEVSSTTALILEHRPMGLPSKDPEEILRHQQEYEAMIEAAKKREQKEAKLRKKQLQQQLRHEKALAASLQVWNVEILPNWETAHNSKRARDLWWQGIPPAVRGKVWELAIGNELNLTQELYEICLGRAKDIIRLINEDGDIESSSDSSAGNRESSVDLIKLDVSRTFPQLCIFQKGGPYYELLQGLLGAYVCYRPDVGYVQGMSFIAAVLLLNMEVADAFITFANLLNRPCQIAFFRLDENLMKSYFQTYELFFGENLPTLYAHFQKQNVTPDLYIIDWMFTLYAKSLPLDVASRVWDVFCRDGEEFLFRTALGILSLYEDVLLNLDFIHLAQFLTRLPENISVENLFQAIENIHMTIDKKRFAQVLASLRESGRENT